LHNSTDASDALRQKLSFMKDLITL